MGRYPFGYDLDAKGYLVPSGRLILGMTEAEIIRDLFERMAAGSTTVAEARRFNALGVPCIRRYAGGKTREVASQWLPSRVNFIIKNTVYRGVHVLASRFGKIEREVPALVSADLWQRANAQLVLNRARPAGTGKRAYLLRGLIRCDDCGTHYAGTTCRRGAWVGYYYRCNGQQGSVHPDAEGRCRAKRLPVAWLDELVWRDCAGFIANPGDVLAEVQRQMQAQLADAADLDSRRAALVMRLDAKDAERGRVLTLFRRGSISLEQVEAQMAVVDDEAAEIRKLLAALDARQAAAKAQEDYLTSASALLERLREGLAEIERTDDWATRRQIVQLLVSGIAVHSEGTGRDKTATVTITYTFGPPSAAVLDSTASATRNYRR